jgi:hypothetical protein
MSNNKSSINKIIKEIEVKKLKELYGEFNDVITLISNFILKKNLILYGGLVINLILPKKYRFYKEYTINDYDCFSKNPVKDAKELGYEIKKAGFEYIKLKRALHTNTYKISVFGKQFFDITFLDAKIYNILLKYINKNNKKLKYYGDKYKVIPVELIKQNLYFELARPLQSGFRWEKIYSRLSLVNSFYPTEKNKKVLKCIPIKESYLNTIKYILEYIKANKLPIIDSYSIKLYMNISLCCYRLSNNSICLTILVKNIRDVFLNIKKIINLYITDSKYKVEVIKAPIDSINLYKYYDIKIYDNETKVTFNMLRIIKIKDQCFSTTVKNSYTLGSIDTCLYFLYYNYINNKIYKNNMNDAMENLYYINQFENNLLKANLNKIPINKRLQTNCYGEIKHENELKEIWNHRLTIKYF